MTIYDMSSAYPPLNGERKLKELNDRYAKRILQAIETENLELKKENEKLENIIREIRGILKNEIEMADKFRMLDRKRGLTYTSDIVEGVVNFRNEL